MRYEVMRRLKLVVVSASGNYRLFAETNKEAREVNWDIMTMLFVVVVVVVVVV